MYGWFDFLPSIPPSGQWGRRRRMFVDAIVWGNRRGRRIHSPGRAPVAGFGLGASTRDIYVISNTEYFHRPGALQVPAIGVGPEPSLCLESLGRNLGWWPASRCECKCPCQWPQCECEGSRLCRSCGVATRDTKAPLGNQTSLGSPPSPPGTWTRDGTATGGRGRVLTFLAQPLFCSSTPYLAQCRANSVHPFFFSVFPFPFRQLAQSQRVS